MFTAIIAILKSKIIPIVIIALLILAILVLLFFFKRLREEKRRLDSNQQTLIGEVKYYKLKDSSNVAVVGELQLKVSELKDAKTKELMDLKDRIKQLDIKLRNVAHASDANITIESDLEGRLEDKPPPGDIFSQEFNLTTTPLKYLHKVTKWNDVHILYNPSNDSIKLKVITYDKMTQVIYKTERGWPWQKSFWHRRKYEQAVTFENPDTKISYPTFITIKKR